MTSKYIGGRIAAHLDVISVEAQAQNCSESLEFSRAYCELKVEINEWEGCDTPTASDKKIRDDKLAELRLQFTELDQVLRRGDYPNLDEATMHGSTKNNVLPTHQQNKILNENKWDEQANRKLLNELGQPGATHRSIAKKYGVTRQRIGAQVKKAQESLLPRRKASPFDALAIPSLKK